MKNWRTETNAEPPAKSKKKYEEERKVLVALIANTARIIDRKTKILETSSDPFGFIRHAQLLRDVHLEFFKKEKEF